MECVLSYVHYISLHIYIDTYRKEQIYSKEENCELWKAVAATGHHHFR